MMPMINFKLQAFIDCINELVRADETARALWLCDNLPAYYRDHKPKEIVDLKNDIIARTATSAKYAFDLLHAEQIPKPEFQVSSELTIRAVLLDKEVELFNKDGITPHIVDMGPGFYYLPRMLANRKRDFTYFPICLDLHTLNVARKPFEDKLMTYKGNDRPKIFVACEVIEHLWNEQEIKSNMLTFCGWPDVAHISTPKYTFGFNLEKHEDNKQLEHLRAYTPKEFQEIVADMFGEEYQPFYYDNEQMHLRLLKKDSIFELEANPDISKEVEYIKKTREEIFNAGE